MAAPTWKVLLVSCLLLGLVLACKFSASTANLSALKLGKDKAVSQETSTFGPNDTVYGEATLSNSMDKSKLKGRLVIEDVEGQQPGPIAPTETTLDMPGSGTATFTFTPPANGWPKGKYKLEVLLLIDDQQKDEKSVSFTVS